MKTTSPELSFIKKKKLHLLMLKSVHNLLTPDQLYYTQLIASMDLHLK